MPLTKPSKTYLLKTHGCKANLYDSQLIEKRLQDLGYTLAQSDEQADVCIVNSCSVTNEADRQSLRSAQKLNQTNPNAAVIMTGCSVQANDSYFSNQSSIDYLVGNQNKNALYDLLEKNEIHKNSHQPIVLGDRIGYDEMRSRHPMDREWALPEEIFFHAKDLKNKSGESSAGRTRVFLKVQEGCNSFCTYCIIPYGRGPSRSLKPSQVLDQVKLLIDQDVKEIVLTGTNLGDYGIEWAKKGQALDELLELILTQTSLPRLRLTSLDPTEITPKMLEMMSGESSLCPHFHVSLQSPHSKVLKRMKRRYTSKEVESCLNQLAQVRSKNGNVFVGMDLIAGFPGESEEIFEESFELMKSLPWTRMHVFPYSERASTPATKLDQSVDPRIRKVRTKKWMELSNQRLSNFLHQQKSNSLIPKVLIESKLFHKNSNQEFWRGHSTNYAKILIPHQAHYGNLTNQILDVSPFSVQLQPSTGDGSLIAELHHFSSELQ